MKHAPAIARKFRNAARQASALTGPHLPGGFFLTDPGRVEDVRAIIGALPEGIGVIIRHFGQADAIETAHLIVSDCKKARRLVLIAADPALARATGASGVHWPFRLRHRIRRSRNGEAMIQTLSVHSTAELRMARHCPVDACLYSTVFRSDSPSAGSPMGLMRFAIAARQSPKPLYALGGITHDNAESIARFGGFASVSAFEDLA